MRPDPPTPVSRSAAEDIARRLRAMADPTRVQILSSIVSSDDGRRTVTDLADELGLRQPTVTHHLKLLVDEGVLERTQDGRQVWHSVAPDRSTEVFDSVTSVPIATALARPTLDRIVADLTGRFRGTLSRETVAKYVRESYELLAKRSGITRYLPSLTARFAGDRLQSLARSTAAPTDGVPDVLFVCVQNAGRSQLASALLKSLAGDRVRVLTAGSEPASAINPKILAALDEIGVPVSSEYPKPLTDEVVRAADYVVTMGCGDACPVYPGRTYLDWELPDPANLSMDGVRAVRDEIETRVRRLLADIEA